MIPDWIAVDWGQTRQRAWAMRGGDVLARTEREGAAAASIEAFVSLFDAWLNDSGIPVLACGSLGPVRGQVPCTPLAEGVWAMDIGDARLSLHVAPGIRQTTPPDMMQGDETRIAGFLNLNKDWDGVICLVGSETRWVHVSAGEIVSFQTFLTQAMLDALAHQTALGRWLTGFETDREAFTEALSDAMARPEKVMARLYGVHAEGTLDGLEPDIARARIVGGLIGAELAAARPFWLGQQLAVIGNGPLAQLYVDALSAQGVSAALADEEHMTREGLTIAWRGLSA